MKEIIAWRTRIEERVKRLEEGKEQIFAKLDNLTAKMDEHIVQCAKSGGETKAQLDALTSSIMRIEGALTRNK